jgi:hypothetical protein
MCLNTSATRQQIEDEYDDCEDEQDVDETATDVEAEAQQPKNEENNDDRPKHGYVSRTAVMRLARGLRIGLHYGLSSVPGVEPEVGASS